MYAQFKFPQVPWAVKKIGWAIKDWKHWPTIRFYVWRFLKEDA
jgi:hypothetical protein